MSRWLARQFVHFDANFRLVLESKAKKTYTENGLWEGNGFFVEEKSYKEYLEKPPNPQVVSARIERQCQMSDS
jgi:hypothetical protein